MTGMDTIGGLALALGLGLLVGMGREQREPPAGAAVAGVRTFALITLSGALAEYIGGAAVIIAGAFIALAALASYRVSRTSDPGLTSELAMLVMFLLGVLAMREAALAAGLGVLVAGLLSVKSRLHHFAQRLLTEAEYHDALLLAAAAAIVLPLLPDRTVDPWGVVNLRSLWLLAVIVMAINAGGYIAIRAFGPRTGLLLAGLAGGFASSTATIAGMGARARAHPELASACAGAGVVSNISTLIQLAVVAATLSPALLTELWQPLLAAGVVIAAFSLLAARAAHAAPEDAAVPVGRAFELKHALLFVLMLAGVMLLSAATLAWLGDAALNMTLVLSGLADVHAAAASAMQLQAVGRISDTAALNGIGWALAANSAMKIGMAFATGGRSYGMRLAPGVAGMAITFLLVSRWVA